jgi:hypothetical protein
LKAVKPLTSDAVRNAVLACSLSNLFLMSTALAAKTCLV